MKLVLFLLVFLTVLFGSYAYATSLEVDKSTYNLGDDIKLTGSVLPYEPGAFISLQILNPSKSDFVQIDTFLPNADGTFTKIYKADGPKWASDGKYTLKLFYGGEEFQTTFQFEKTIDSNSEPKQNSSKESQSESPPKPKTTSEQRVEAEPKLTQTKNNQKPKTHIPGFPSLNESPQYYYDRYANEPDYKEWFDSQFPGKVISDVVGYKSTHIANFPDKQKSPSYYINRYKSESDYKEWFDSQFPGKTIYQVLGFPDPKSVPDWIKSNAEWWSRGQISDDDFVSGIQYMIENKIIVIPNIPQVANSGNQEVPNWVRNNANWWALDKISEEEFLNAIKYLIENGIIAISE